MNMKKIIRFVFLFALFCIFFQTSYNIPVFAIVSTAPSSDDITVVNNSDGTPDTVTVANISNGDMIKIYNTQTSTIPIGGAASTGTSAAATIYQLGKASGKIYASITSSGETESTRVIKTYSGESVSVTPNPNDIAVVNNPEGTPDTVIISNQSAGDLVKVYNTKVSNSPIGCAASTGAPLTIPIYQLGKSTGNIYVTVTNSGKPESTRASKSYTAEQITPAIAANDITITNNSEGTPDTVVVNSVNTGEVIKVFSMQSLITPIGGVISTGSSATVTIFQIGKHTGTLYVSRTIPGMLESARTTKIYSAETASAPLDPTNITVVNNVEGVPDTITVVNLNVNDTVKAYATPTSTLSIASTMASSPTVTMSVYQLGRKTGNLYFSVTNYGMLESTRVLKPYLAEAVSVAPADTDITITNNFGVSSDAIDIVNLTAGDIVKVYSSSAATASIKSVTVSGTSVTIPINQLRKTGGSVFLTITNTGKLESTRTLKTYPSEPISVPPAASDIAIANNVEGTSDTITVSNLTAGDIVKVFNSPKATVPIKNETATGASLTLSIPQLGKSSGTTYVSITNLNKMESSYTGAAYTAEPVSTAPALADIIVTNNVGGISDTVLVNNLTAGDVVKVYSSQISSSPIGGVTSSGASATVTILQLGKTAGRVYVTVTNSGIRESSRTTQSYTAEPATLPSSAADITVTNNTEGTQDTIAVSNLSVSDVVKVYSKQSTAYLIGSATSTGTSVTISVNQLGKAIGTIYVTKTTTGNLESTFTGKQYTAEPISTAPAVGDITITNNFEGTPDTIDVSNLSTGDIVKVYNTLSTSIPLGGVVSTGTSATMTIYQLGRTAGTTYVSIKRSGGLESPRTTKSYDAEPTTTPLSTGDITVTNNIEGTPDTIVVTNLTVGDIVKIYNSNLVGIIAIKSVTATSASETITVDQLGKMASNIYVTKTSAGKRESPKTIKPYFAEPVSSTPLSTNITIINNPEGTQDTITINGIATGDIIKVYNQYLATIPFCGATSTGASITTSVYQLGKRGGIIYITVTSPGKLESARIAKTFSAE